MKRISRIANAFRALPRSTIICYIKLDQFWTKSWASKESIIFINDSPNPAEGPMWSGISLISYNDRLYDRDLNTRTSSHPQMS